MAYRDLQAPITNPKANQRLKDTQALRARAAVGAATPNTAIAPAAQTTGAALTQAQGQASLAQNQAQSNLAKTQATQVLGQQKLQDTKAINQQTNTLRDSERKLDQSLFNANQEAAKLEQQMRNDFANRKAQRSYLHEMEMLDWLVANAKDEQDFKDKIQVLEQAHKRKAAMIDHSFKLKIQELEQAEAKASAEDAKRLKQELLQIKTAHEKEMERRKAEAANRKTMVGMASQVIGVGVAAVATYFSGGSAAPYAPAIAAGVSSVLQGSGATESGLEKTGNI
jgi:hypothetical protein